MKTSIFTSCAVTALLLLCIGCSFDAMNIVDHPGNVDEGQLFEVALYNQFQHITNGGEIALDIIRDSLHIAVGFGSGWTVEAATFYVARDWDIVGLASKLDDTVALARAIRDSSAAFKARATAMTADGGFAATLSGRKYQADDLYGGNTILVETDSIRHWSCFRGFANIRYTRGTPVDTMGIDSSSGDTTGVSVMPVFAWVTLRAPSNARLDTLYYFSKTAAMPDLEDSANIDVGEIAYAPIRVGNASVIRTPTIAGPRRLSVYAPSGGAALTIDLGALGPDVSSIGIYRLTGVLIRDLTPLLHQGTTITWNSGNARLNPGLYIVRCVTSHGLVSQSFRVVR